MFKLTTEQQAIKEVLLEHINEGKGEGRFDGPAGVGKTVCISDVISDLSRDKKNIFCITFTHKSLSVLKASIGKRASKNVHFMTICSFLGKRLVLDEDGKPDFVYKKTIKKTSDNRFYYMSENGKFFIDVIIIDEWSMVSIEDYQLLNKIKVPTIYLGDGCQITSDGNCIIDNVPLLGELTKVIRTENDGIKNVYQNARDLVKGDVSPDMFIDKLLECNDDCTVHIMRDEKDFISAYNNDDSQPIILDYRVAMVDRYNNRVRGKKQYVDGERLIFTDYYMDYWLLIDEMENEGIDMTKIKKYPCNAYDTMSELGVQVDFSDFSIYTQTHINITTIEEICIHPVFLSEPIEVFKLFYEYENETRFIYKPVDDVSFMKKMKYVKEKFRELLYMPEDDVCFKTEFSELLEKTGLVYPHNFFGVRPCRVDKCMIWNFFSEVTKMISAPVSYSYCISIHRSQGSTYNTVYIDLRSSMGWLEVPKGKEYYKFMTGKIQPDIKDPNEWTIKKNCKLIYTGLSRAKDKITILV